jgi:AraC-like DNA-binding protein
MPSKEYEQTIVELPCYGFDNNKLSIMIIEGNMEILWLICEALAETYNVMPVNSAIGLEFILRNTYPNIIICEVNMNGIDLCRQLKADKRTAHIPVILTSSKQTSEEQIEGVKAGAEMYLAKPFNFDYLGASIERLLSQKETLKEYFNSSLSAYNQLNGKLIHQESRKFMQNLMNAIQNNLTNSNLSVKFIASELGMSPRHLHRKMKEMSEKGVLELITECKLHVASHLLISSKMTIEEIIYKSGFANRTTFFKAFYKKFDCTPKEYRERKESEKER